MYLLDLGTAGKDMLLGGVRHKAPVINRFSRWPEPELCWVVGMLLRRTPGSEHDEKEAYERLGILYVHSGKGRHEHRSPGVYRTISIVQQRQCIARRDGA